MKEREFKLSKDEADELMKRKASEEIDGASERGERRIRRRQGERARLRGYAAKQCAKDWSALWLLCCCAVGLRTAPEMQAPFERDMRRGVLEW
jgi:hypothetical protein